MVNVLLKLSEVLRRTGLSRTEIYERMKRGDFPKSVKVGLRTVRWPSNDVDSWVSNVIEGQRKAA